MSSAVVKKIETILHSPYDTKNYVDLVCEIFPDVRIVAPEKLNKEFSNFSSHIEGSAHVGTFQTPDKKKIIIMAVQLKKAGYVENARSTHRSFAKKLIENGNADAAFIAFYTEGDPKWRLSLVRLDYEMKIENGRLKTAENLTPAKRYSYLVGQDEPCHTAISQFERFITDSAANPERPTLNDLENAFSVEKVTDEFFNLYCEKFHQLREQLEAIEDFRIEAEQHNFTSAQFAKKLMGQIVFLYFLQKKGWLGVGAWPNTLTEKEYKNAFYARGAKSRELIPVVYRPVGDGTYRISSAGLNSISDADEEVLANCVKGKPWGSGPHDFMRRLFNLAIHRNANFYNDLLEPLFYDALNRNRGEQGYCSALHCRIPFLSGGLFEPIDGYDWEHNDFSIPNEVFSNAAEKGRDADGILDIFDRYNFTMSEDEPMEREVAIDPEMLGKVFENLLEINDRKSKGAFYTPREIVHYMCQESLINYLANTLNISEEAIRDFILYGDFMKDEDTVKEKRQGNGGMYISEELYKINPDGTVAVNRLNDMDKALKDVRVADPAVGSGAFPLGMLNEIVRARQNISAYLAITMKPYDVRMMYQMDRSPHTLKYETIRNCIFACDIEPSAVDIAQLRLWLALVIDDEINPNAQTPLDGHRNPLPLPNLESNILCGNSLMDEFEGSRLIKESDLLGSSDYQMDMNSGRFDSIVKKLIDLQDELFRCDDTEKKKQLKSEIESLRDMIILSQLEGCPQDKMQRYNASKHLASKPYVLWKLDFARVFREKGGFDIVIGNPPYGLLNKKQNQNTSIMANEFELACYKNAPLYKPAKGGMINIFRLFICKSFDLLKKDGHLSLIFPMAFMCDLSAYALRDYVLQYNKIDYLEAFPERDNENKRVFKSAKMSVCILGASKIHTERNEKFPMRISRDRFVDTQSPITWMSREDIEIIDKASLTIPLMQPEEYEILLQMCSGNTRLGTVSKCYTGEIDLSLNKKYVKLENTYTRMLRGAQVQKFFITDNISQGDILYLDAETYLNENSSPKSRHHQNRRIVMQGITGVNERYRLKMTISEQGVFCANSVNYLLIDDDELEFFLGLCNSRLLNWFFAKLSTNSNVNGYEVDNLPIRIPSESKKQEIASLVHILLDDASDVSANDLLNSLVYEIYGLSPEQIEVVESSYI